METILERYERYSYAEKMLIAPDTQTQGSWTLESSKLMAKIEVLEKNIRHYVGEDLDPLSLRELQSVEQQLDNALKRIRTRKNQLMHESISELHKKEKALQEQNNSLSKKLKEKEKNITEQVQQQEQRSPPVLLSQPPPLPLHPFPSLTIGGMFETRGAATTEEDGGQTQPCTTLIPPWMLRHINQ